MTLLTAIKEILIPKAHAGAWDIYCEAMGACGSGKYFLVELAARAANFVFLAIGGAAVIAIIWGATGFITSAFNDQGRENAKSIIKFALLGLLLAILGAGIVKFVQATVELILPK